MQFFPFSELFGYAPNDSSPEAVAARAGKLCPPRGPGELCTKTAPNGSGKKDVLGVCSLAVRNSDDPKAAPVAEILCPHRFREETIVFDELKDFLLPGAPNVIFVPEVRVHSKETPIRPAAQTGNVDWTACAVDEGKVVEYGTVEFQGLYTSGGGVQAAFNDYMALPEPRDTRKVPEQKVIPTPDYRSSGRKRLAPQLKAKGPAFLAEGNKQAIVLTAGLYDKEFGPFIHTTVPEEEADLLWLLVEVDPASKPGLKVSRRIYTDYVTAMAELDDVPVADLERFENALQDKVNAVVKKANLEALKAHLAEEALAAKMNELQE